MISTPRKCFFLNNCFHHSVKGTIIKGTITCQQSSNIVYPSEKMVLACKKKYALTSFTFQLL